MARPPCRSVELPVPRARFAPPLALDNWKLERETNTKVVSLNQDQPFSWASVRPSSICQSAEGEERNGNRKGASPSWSALIFD